MPVTLDRGPGVYVTELPSAVHSIVGVPTAVTAFVGFASRGAPNQPVQVHSFAEFERGFGPLDVNYPMSVAVSLFFLNGGKTAEIVRLIEEGKEAKAGKPAEAVVFEDATGKLKLAANSPGKWGEQLEAVVSSNNQVQLDKNGKLEKVEGSGQFDLTIIDNATGISETYSGLTLGPGPKYVGAALSSSQLVIATVELAKAKGAPGGEEKGGAAKGAEAKGAAEAAPAAEGAAPKGAKAKGAGEEKGEAPAAAEGAAAGAGEASKPKQTKLGGEAEDPGNPEGTPPPLGDEAKDTGIYALRKADIINILCLPTRAGQTYSAETLSKAVAFCKEQRAMLIVDPPSGWAGELDFAKVVEAFPLSAVSENAAVYYPNLRVRNPADGTLQPVGPSGAIAGVWAETDETRGVWKAPAGEAATITAISDLNVHVTEAKCGELNPLGVNCLRTLALVGDVVWGARTTKGSDQLQDQWKYVPVRRTALFIEESLRRGTQWVVFEPNDEPLWAKIRLDVGTFMNTLFQQGAFQGATPKEAYLVKCDKENNPQSQIDLGIVNILVGFAPLYPAEFVIISIQQRQPGES